MYIFIYLYILIIIIINISIYLYKISIYYNFLHLFSNKYINTYKLVRLIKLPISLGIVLI